MNSVQQTAPGKDQLKLIESLPVPLAAMMMQQLARASKLFPAERRELDRSLQALMPPRKDGAEQGVQMFATIRLSPELQHLDWRSDPMVFVEKMTAELWSSGQIGTFRDAAKLLAPTSAAEPESPKPAPRFVAVVFDRSLRASGSTPFLFRKLREYGTFFPHADDERGTETLGNWIAARATADPEPYAHWRVSGDKWGEGTSGSVMSLSYDGLRPARQQLLAFFNKTRNTEASGGPQGMRQALLRLTPEKIGLDAIEDQVLRSFALDIFTEGSGTQVYSTTFVQWTVREVLRRAQPQTVLARFAPRSEAISMDRLISHPEIEPPEDGPGSLIDGEMGAYLSYVNLMRLPGAERASFLVWHEGYGQALLIGSGMPRGAQSSSEMNVEKLLALTV